MPDPPKGAEGASRMNDTGAVPTSSQAGESPAWGVSWKVVQGPRPEIQDVPFCLRLSYTSEGFKLLEGANKRNRDEWLKDTTLNRYDPEDVVKRV